VIVTAVAGLGSFLRSVFTRQPRDRRSVGLTDVDLGDPDVQRGISADLSGALRCLRSRCPLMWVADAAYGSRLNAAATDLVMTAYGIPNQTICATAPWSSPVAPSTVLTFTSLPGGWSQFIARHQAVPVDTANPNS